MDFTFFLKAHNKYIDIPMRSTVYLQVSETYRSIFFLFGQASARTSGPRSTSGRCFPHLLRAARPAHLGSAPLERLVLHARRPPPHGPMQHAAPHVPCLLRAARPAHSGSAPPERLTPHPRCLPPRGPTPPEHHQC